ncbi:MAG TPA: polysaccharide deacetylase family protein [Gammaproteobacteria bacterium]|nr:polysaccharide deacetylase family protein [Gammaproteobacteria bacterium]
MKLRTVAKTAGSYALYHSGALRLNERLRGGEPGPVVVGLHRVVKSFRESSKGHMAPMLTSSSRLERYLNWMGRRRRFVSLEEAVANDVAGSASPVPLAAITFDDGYRDVYYNAFPLLRRKRIPFAVFVVSDLVGTERLQVHDELYLLCRRALRRWRESARPKLEPLLTDSGCGQVLSTWDGDAMKLTRAILHALPQDDVLHLLEKLRRVLGDVAEESSHLRPLTWQMLEEMHAAGVTVGSHGCNHALLTQERAQRVASELRGSKTKLEEHLDSEVRYFAYPDGKFNTAVVAAVAEAGYEAAFTTCPHRDPAHPALTVPRRLLWENACVSARGRPSPAVLECLLGGAFDVADKCLDNHDA